MSDIRSKTFSSLLISISAWVFLLFELSPQDIVTYLQKDEDRQKSNNEQGELGSQT